MRLKKVVVERVTVVKFRVDNRGSDGIGCFSERQHIPYVLSELHAIARPSITLVNQSKTAEIRNFSTCGSPIPQVSVG